MAVASKSAVSARNPQVSLKARAAADLNSGVKLVSVPAHNSPSRSQLRGQIPILPNSRSVPSWLLRLCYLQQGTSKIALLLAAAMLAVYSWTAYSQQKWSQAYRKLETLQLHERQLMTSSEVLKNQMAQQALQPSTGLVPANPAEAIVLQPAPQRPSRAAEPLPTSAHTDKPIPIPLGY
ncbi:hypothetical protein [Chroococcidiopsis sp. CCMEE 29]|uniref:hypothetical protein n=1 Tax=Chroococcidiopsis sp. CCMEE 29 TaxID=155894 RepID=UPI00202049A3|nr:hypothetical protein [Chroococcidiopsis sp. CCMEE 29]